MATTKIKKIAVFDIETGGFDFKKHAMCEVAILILDAVTLEEVDRYEALIKPYNEKLIYTKDAEETHGISMETLANEGKEASEVAKESFDILKKHKPILAGHKIDTFDTPFFDNFLSSFKFDLAKCANLSTSIDTLDWSFLRYVKSEKYNLSTVCAKEGIVNENAHRAMSDVEANAEFVKVLLNALRGKGEVAETKLRPKFRFEFQFDGR